MTSPPTVRSTEITLCIPTVGVVCVLAISCDVLIDGRESGGTKLFVAREGEGEGERGEERGRARNCHSIRSCCTPPQHGLCAALDWALLSLLNNYCIATIIVTTLITVLIACEHAAVRLLPARQRRRPGPQGGNGGRQRGQEPPRGVGGVAPPCTMKFRESFLYKSFYSLRMCIRDRRMRWWLTSSFIPGSTPTPPSITRRHSSTDTSSPRTGRTPCYVSWCV